MSAEFFLDTNILVYSFDTDNLAKQTIARRLIDRKDWFVSWQVVQEFSSVALHRFKVPLKQEDLGDYIGLRLWPACRVFPSEEVFQLALSIHGRWSWPPRRREVRGFFTRRISNMVKKSATWKL
jgi:predicted nucleic acid-binding protein